MNMDIPEPTARDVEVVREIRAAGFSSRSPLEAAIVLARYREEIVRNAIESHGPCHGPDECSADEVSRLKGEVERLTGENTNLEAALRGVHGIELADGTVVNVAALQADKEAAESRAAKAETDASQARIGTLVMQARAKAAEEQVRTLREAARAYLAAVMTFFGVLGPKVSRAEQEAAKVAVTTADDTLRAMIGHPDSCEHGARLKNYCSQCAVLATPSPAPVPEHVCGLSGYNGMIDPPCPGPGHLGPPNAGREVAAAAYEEAAKVAELADNAVIFRMPGSLVENTKAYIAERIRALARTKPPAPVPVETPGVCAGIGCGQPISEHSRDGECPAPAPEAAQETKGLKVDREAMAAARVDRAIELARRPASPAKEER